MIDSNNFIGPAPPKWRKDAAMAYFNDKLYYLGGKIFKIWLWKNANRVDVRRWNESP